MLEENSLGYLLFLVSRGHHNLASRVFKQIGLHRGQPQVLFKLGRYEGITQSELAQKLELTQATLTNLLHRMETSGLITRVRDTSDARCTRLYLTVEGKKMLARAIEKRKVMDDTAFAGFSSEEMNSLSGYLQRIHANLNRE